MTEHTPGPWSELAPIPDDALGAGTIDCPECGEIFHDNDYDTGKGDGCHCHGANPQAAQGHQSGGNPMTCSECGNPFRSRQPTATFCGTHCRKAFNNRRATRGAMLYDLFMQQRQCRKDDRNHWSIMCRLEQHWVADDNYHRAGRRSWLDPDHITVRLPFLKAVARGVMRIGARVGR